MDRLGNGPANACEIAFKIDEANVAFWNQIVLSQDKEKTNKSFWSLRKEEKTGFKSKTT